MARGWFAPLVLVLACKGSSGKPALVAKQAQDGGIAAFSATVEAPPIPPLVLGMSSAASYDYRHHGGEAAFKRARAAEAAGSWSAVATACTEALAADPEHLDAAYLLAIALAKTDASPSAIATPLAKAIGGDVVKWSRASLVQPALAAFWATPIGNALHARIDESVAQLTAALARSLLVTAHGELYAVDLATPRWHRLTRTGGAVVGTLRLAEPRLLAYVTRRRSKAHGTAIAIGTVELASGITHGFTAIAGAEAAPSIRVAFNQKKLGAFVVSNGRSWFAVGEGDPVALRAVPAKEHPGYPAYFANASWIDVTGQRAQLVRLSLPDVAADWDDHTLASAIKVTTSNRVITVPSPGLIDGSTITWSPDHTQLAFVAQLDDTCAPGVPAVATFIADAATGHTREIERAVSGLAVDWLPDQRVAIAGDTGVSIYSSTRSPAEVPPQHLDDADGLVVPRATVRCAPPPAADTAPPDESPDEPTP